MVITSRTRWKWCLRIVQRSNWRNFRELRDMQLSSHKGLLNRLYRHIPKRPRRYSPLVTSWVIRETGNSVVTTCSHLCYSHGLRGAVLNNRSVELGDSCRTSDHMEKHHFNGIWDPEKSNQTIVTKCDH